MGWFLVPGHTWSSALCRALPRPTTGAVPGLLAPLPTGPWPSTEAQLARHWHQRSPPPAPILRALLVLTVPVFDCRVRRLCLVTRSRSRMSSQRHCTCRYLLIFVMPGVVSEHRWGHAAQPRLSSSLPYLPRYLPAQWIDTL